MFYSFIDAKDVGLQDENEDEVINPAERKFIRSMLEEDEEETDLFTRRLPPGCVRCKFNLFKCCAPNICRKKTLRPDKCIKIKAPKGLEIYEE